MASDLIFTTVSLGLGVAASHRIGNLLGSGNASTARRAARAPYILSVIFGTIEFAGIMTARRVYGYLFTDDESVGALTACILPLMAGFQILDLANGGAGGILRGAARNHWSGLCNLIAYYCVGLPSAWYFCFSRELGLLGLWMGIITGSLALLVFQTICICLVHWEREVAKLSEEEHG